VPRVWTVHDIMPITHPSWYPARHRHLARRALELIRRSHDLVITVSAAVERDLLVEGVDAERIRVVHHGVDDRFRARATTAEIDSSCARHGVTPGAFLLAVGGISERKNLAVLVSALERVTPAGTPPELLVTGSHGHGAAGVLDRLAGLGERVRAAGYLPDADVAVLMQAALAVVHPSRDEGFGLVPVEAMAAGTPVVASRSGAMPETMGSAGIQLDPDDVDGWAAAIERLRDDEAHRDDLIRAGSAHAAHFTWERAARATQAVQLEALDRSR
jgi:glycosyltransferase involved in cell wall biosynthesis